jgi:hypothetical protein
MMGHKSINCKNKIRQTGFQNGSQTNNQSGGQNHGNQVNLHNGAYYTYCRRPGHYKSNCMKLKKKHNRNSGTSTHNNQERQVHNSNDVAFTSFETKNNLSSDVWILNSGASCHYSQSMEGLTDVKDVNESIKIGNGCAMRACKIGNLNCEVTQLDGRKFVVSLKNVKFVPRICSNLFSLNKALMNGFTLANDGVIVSLTKKHVTLSLAL